LGPLQRRSLYEVVAGIGHRERAGPDRRVDILDAIRPLRRVDGLARRVMESKNDQNHKACELAIQPPVEIAGDLAIKLHVPYSESTVAIQVSPSIDDYSDKQDDGQVQIRQVMVSSSTDETTTLSFDFEKRRKQSLNFRGVEYQLELTDIGKQEIEGQDFFYYEFMVSDEAQ
jgi:hypothetical protein